MTQSTSPATLGTEPDAAESEEEAEVTEQAAPPEEGQTGQDGSPVVAAD